MATKKQTISFTALPNGVAPSGKLRVSVFVSPRLWTDDPATTKVNLSEFPDWLDWPSTSLSFSLKFGGASAVSATRVGAAPESDLWTMLFSPTTYLLPRTFDAALADTKLISYSVKDVHTKLKSVYTYFAKNNPENFPTVAELLADDSPFRDIATPAFPVEPDEGPPIIKSVRPLTTPAYDAMKRLTDFHKPFLQTKVPITAPDIEFHQMLSALGKYPVLMRMLGLVHDLEVDSPGSLGATTVEAIVSWPTAPAMPHLLTRCFVGASAFYATPRASDPELSSDGLGMLRFDDTDDYELVQVNHDGAAFKQLRFAETLVRATFDPADPVYALSKDSKVKLYKTDDTPMAYSLPSVGSVGLAVARNKRDEVVKAHLAISKTNNAAIEALGTVTLDAEDLTRGYAIDVHDGTSSHWYSLNERVGTYTFASEILSDVVDEGWISLGLTKAPDGSSTDTKLAETLFKWWGWSLSAPRPGKSMDDTGQPVEVENTPTTQFNLQVDFVARPGSLPRLRFGTSYRLRARAVDLAGNRTLRTAVSGLANATNAVVYGRFEPVSSPEVVLDDALDPGEARDNIVIRSNYDTKIDEPGVRHIAPPKAAEPTLETLGVLDATAGGVDPKAYKLLQQKDGGSWTDIGKPDPNNPGVVFVKEEGNKLPYLPDLLSRGAVLRGLPGTASAVRVGFGYDKNDWPDARPFDLELREGSSAPTFDAGPRRLNVQLGKADTASVRLSSYLDPDKGDVDRMALLRWLEELEPGTVDTFRQQIADGVHWMVTPFRTLTLVHAVRQPLLRPKYVSVSATKAALGQTYATLADPSMQVSRKSTVRLDILATWPETIDSLANPGPIQAQGNARPYQFKVPLATTPATENVLSVTGRHEFNDTKHRQVTYAADATSRFAEYFAQSKDHVQLHAGKAVELHPPVHDDGINWGGVVPGSVSVTAADRSTRYGEGTDYTVDYLAGRLTPSASLDGKSVNITFIAPPIVRRTETPVELDVLSSARPSAPKVLYLVPTFGWSQSNNADVAYTSQRRGGGLRAYLERPWFSSGDGELLGAVLWSGAWPPPEDAKQHITDWGLDPLYKSAGTAAQPSIGAFKTATARKTTDLSLEEMPGVTTFQVAGHPVAYDAERKLWYCDIEIDAGASYTPFVRLALARFQPHSMKDAHLSRVVLADFVQLTANRAASITRPKKESDTFTIAVSGQSYSMVNTAAGPSTVEVSFEKRRAETEPDKQGELAWEQVPASTKALTPSAGPAGTTMWTGTLTLPPKPHGDRFRIVIQEFEKFGATAADRRLVYADAIEVQR